MKKRNKKKFNFVKFITTLIILFCLFMLFRYLLEVKTKNIVILNNDYYTDEQIIEKANLQDYPKFILLNKNKIRKDLKELELIEDVDIEKTSEFVLKLKIKEKKILYLIRSKQEYMTSDGKSYDLENVYGVPTLINYVPEDVEKLFIKEFSKIDKNIINLISEIEYSKSEYDDKRFLLYMNDGNEVYITVYKVDILNKYIDIVKKLEGKNGILYLDSGNYFEIKN